MLFEEACYLYVEAKSEGRKKVRPNTLEGYMSAIRCHLMPKWSGREVESITADELQAWVDSFERPGAARKAFNTFRQIHRWHLRTHRVRIYDETQGVELPTAPRRKPAALTAKQAKLGAFRGYGLPKCGDSVVCRVLDLDARCGSREGQAMRAVQRSRDKFVRVVPEQDCRRRTYQNEALGAHSARYFQRSAP